MMEIEVFLSAWSKPSPPVSDARCCTYPKLKIDQTKSHIQGREFPDFKITPHIKSLAPRSIFGNKSRKKDKSLQAQDSKHTQSSSQQQSLCALRDNAERAHCKPSQWRENAMKSDAWKLMEHKREEKATLFDCSRGTCTFCFWDETYCGK